MTRYGFILRTGHNAEAEADTLAEAIALVEAESGSVVVLGKQLEE